MSLALALAFALAAGGPAAEEPSPGDLLEEIIVIPGVSGHEAKVREAIRARLPAWASEAAKVDEHGNLIVEVGEGDPSILFVAHMDEIGFEVTEIAEDGSLRLKKLGGFLDTLYEGEIVEVHTRDAVVSGVIAPRLPGAERFAASQIRLDLGTTTAAETAELGIAPKDTITITKEFDRLLGKRMMGRAMDDRVGSAALLWAIRQVNPQGLSRKTTFVWSTSEEVGLVGARGLARTRSPTYVFAVDTFVSSDSPRENQRFALATLGGGAAVRAIDRSNIAPYADVMRLVRLAGERDVPIQYGVTGGGNDGSVFVSKGSVDLPIAWPLRNSHSAVEIIDEGDLVALARLIVGIAEEF